MDQRIVFCGPRIYSDKAIGFSVMQKNPVYRTSAKSYATCTVIRLWSSAKCLQQIAQHVANSASLVVIQQHHGENRKRFLIAVNGARNLG